MTAVPGFNDFQHADDESIEFAPELPFVGSNGNSTPSPRRTLGDLSTKKSESSPRGESQPPSPRGRPFDLRELEQKESFATAAMKVMGISAANGKSFTCVLPKPEHAKTSIVKRTPGGRFVYLCECDRIERSLTEVFAAYISGQMRRRNPPEFARWGIRLAAETGFARLPAVELPPLSGNPSALRIQVYQGLRRLVAVRALVGESGEPFPFSRGFAAEWCGGLDDERGQVKDEIDALRAQGILVKDGTATGGRFPVNLYRVGVLEDRP